ncbi:hypothetical protein CsSME_00037760 [Camellia sinensis var. sinensis]
MSVVGVLVSLALLRCHWFYLIRWLLPPILVLGAPLVRGLVTVSGINQSMQT